MHGLKRLAFGVRRNYAGGRMRPVEAPTRIMAGGKMRWSGLTLHRGVRTFTAEDPRAQKSLFLKDNIKNLTGSGSVQDKLAREYRSYMGSSGSGHRHRRTHRSNMSGRGLHLA